METTNKEALQAKITSLEATVKELQEKEAHWYILKDLALPNTSLAYLNLAVWELQELHRTNRDKQARDTILAITRTTNQAIGELIELELARALILIQEAIFLAFTSCTSTMDVLDLLNKSAGKIVMNQALEQLIFEGNASIL